MSAKLSGIEVVDQIRLALRGEVSVSLADDRSWNETFAGDCVFNVGGWRVVFFNDCDELDYCDSASTPDGRRGDFDDWASVNEEPVGLLASDELSGLEAMLETARPNTERGAGGVSAPRPKWDTGGALGAVKGRKQRLTSGA